MDLYLATPYLRKKAPTDVEMVPKTTAGMEQNLWLIERNSRSQAKIKPTSADARGSHQHESEDSLQPQLALTALETREMLIQEKDEQIKMKENRLVVPASMVAQDLLSLATELGSIVLELRRNIEASGRILRAHNETPRLRAAACCVFLGEETLRPFPLRASTDCAAQTQSTNFCFCKNK